MTNRLVHYFHDHLLDCYHTRVQKLCLDGGFTCPNRDGTKAYGGCLFCDASGSAAAHIPLAEPVAEQIRRQKQSCRQRYGAQKFIAYFQAFTNTYAPLPRLKSLYEQALSDPDVIGLSVGTRADCLDEQICALLAGFAASGRRIWVEIGIQTVNQATLDRMNRAETVEDYRRACRLVNDAGLELVVHVIAGLPGDSREDFLRTVAFVNEMEAQGIKIHNLYIDSRAALARDWQAGCVPILEFSDYVSLVCDALERLSPRCLIHRLCGQAPRPYHLAPTWALDKNRVMRAIEAELARRATAHGCAFDSSVALRSS